LFLAGENALDIEAAQRRGFAPKNMIAVERDPEALQKLRHRGVLTIDGDLCDVLNNWPTTKNVSAVLADFCCGLEERICTALVWTSINPAFADSVFAVNMLRGRERTNEDILDPRFGSGGKHRGMKLFDVVSCDPLLGDLPDDASDSEIQQTLARREPHWRRMTSPAFYSYKSTAGRQAFDCVVWKNPLGMLARQDADFETVAAKGHHLQRDPKGIAQRRRTAAVLATHTRRHLVLPVARTPA
jgi:hypothetical protein